MFLNEKQDGLDIVYTEKKLYLFVFSHDLLLFFFLLLCFELDRHYLNEVLLFSSEQAKKKILIEKFEK